MVKIKNVGDRPYQAVDHGQDGRLIAIPPNGEREVSDEHAEQLLKDFPDRFKKATAAAAKKPADAGGKDGAS